jgi:dethiobiotin synthetase
MKKRIFITATNTDIGKSYTTRLLLRAFASRGLSVGVIKPVETGVENKKYPDGDALLALVRELNPLFCDVVVEDIVPISHPLAAAPFVASGGALFDMQKVFRSVEKLEKLCDILLIEGAGGLLVPLDENTMVLDMIQHLDATALLVTHCALGCINDTLLSKKALDDAGVANRVVFNPRTHDEAFERLSEPYFKAKKWDILKTDRDIDRLCDVLYNL